MARERELHWAAPLFSVFSISADEEIPLPLGNAYFQFKHELGENVELLEFYSLGPKTYCILCREKGGDKVVKQIIKVRGFHLQSDGWTKEEINAATIKYFVDQRLSEDLTHVRHVPHFNIRIDPRTKRPYSLLSVKRFGNDTYNKRVYFSGCDSVDFTMPFGYTKEMLAERLSKLERRGKN